MAGSEGWRKGLRQGMQRRGDAVVVYQVRREVRAVGEERRRGRW